jgi:hypothetical protein
MSASWLRVLGLMVASSWLALGCSSSSKKTGVGGACVQDSDCDKLLACAMDKCHATCMFLDNCLTGESCVNTTSTKSTDAGNQTVTTAICQLPGEADCTSTTCKGGLLCASDLRCRSTCKSYTDCTYGQFCAGAVCAYPDELVNGQLPQKNPSLSSDASVPAADAGGEGGGLDLTVGPPDAPRGADGAGPETPLDVPGDLAASEEPDAGVDLVTEEDASEDIAVSSLASDGP